jgi:glycopeptide antibiotics resistance protein
MRRATPAQAAADASVADAGAAHIAPTGELGGRALRRAVATRRVPRALLAAATAAYLAFIAWLTLGPEPYDPAAAGLLDRVLAFVQGIPLTAWVTFDLVEFTANIALFVPLGALLVLLLGVRRRWLVLAIAVALTCGIELAQGAWLPTRVSDPRDVVANSAGAALGIALVLTIRRLRRRDGSPA